MIEYGGDQWGTPAEIAHQLGVSTQCIYDWRRSGLLSEDAVRQYGRGGRYLVVALTAAAQAEKAARHRGRPRATMAT